MKFWHCGTRMIAAFVFLTSTSVLASDVALDNILRAGGTPITGKALSNLLNDKTIFALDVNKDSIWAEYFTPDGQVFLDDGNLIYRGTWKPSGQAACFNFPERRNLDRQCFLLYSVNDRIYGLLDNGSNGLSLSFRVEWIAEGDEMGLAPIP